LEECTYIEREVTGSKVADTVHVRTCKSLIIQRVRADNASLTHTHTHTHAHTRTHTHTHTHTCWAGAQRTGSFSQVSPPQIGIQPNESTLFFAISIIQSPNILCVDSRFNRSLISLSLILHKCLVQYFVCFYTYMHILKICVCVYICMFATVRYMDAYIRVRV